MRELCRLELARTITAKNKNKVSHHKDTVENWSPIAGIQCLTVSNIQNVYLCQTMQPSSNTNSCNPFISHQHAKLEKQKLAKSLVDSDSKQY